MSRNTQKCDAHKCPDYLTVLITILHCPQDVAVLLRDGPSFSFVRVIVANENRDNLYPPLAQLCVCFVFLQNLKDRLQHELFLFVEQLDLVPIEFGARPARAAHLADGFAGE